MLFFWYKRSLPHHLFPLNSRGVLMEHCSRFVMERSVIFFSSTTSQLQPLRNAVIYFAVRRLSPKADRFVWSHHECTVEPFFHSWFLLGGGILGKGELFGIVSIVCQFFRSRLWLLGNWAFLAECYFRLYSVRFQSAGSYAMELNRYPFSPCKSLRCDVSRNKF